MLPLHRDSGHSFSETAVTKTVLRNQTFFSCFTNKMYDRAEGQRPMCTFLLKKGNALYSSQGGDMTKMNNPIVINLPI